MSFKAETFLTTLAFLLARSQVKIRLFFFFPPSSFIYDSFLRAPSGFGLETLDRKRDAATKKDGQWRLAWRFFALLKSVTKGVQSIWQKQKQQSE